MAGAASSCNAFAISTFSSNYYLLTFTFIVFFSPVFRMFYMYLFVLPAPICNQFLLVKTSLHCNSSTRSSGLGLVDVRLKLLVLSYSFHLVSIMAEIPVDV